MNRIIRYALALFLAALLLAGCGKSGAGEETENGNSVTGGTPVDMGLSVLWADRNVGAQLPEEPGTLFGYGDAGGQNRSEHAEDYVTSGDAAAQAWGSGWRLPTEAEMQELVERCTWVWVADDDRRGYEVTAPSGAKIFLPTTGHRLGNSVTRKKGFGGYWTSSPSAFSEYHARHLSFVPARLNSLRADSLKHDPAKSTFKMGDCMRQYGLAVRPVRK